MTGTACLAGACCVVEDWAPTLRRVREREPGARAACLDAYQRHASANARAHGASW